MLLTQRLQDVEAQDVFAQMGGVQGNEPREREPGWSNRCSRALSQNRGKVKRRKMCTLA